MASRARKSSSKIHCSTGQWCRVQPLIVPLKCLCYSAGLVRHVQSLTSEPGNASDSFFQKQYPQFENLSKIFVWRKGWQIDSFIIIHMSKKWQAIKNYVWLKFDERTCRLINTFKFVCHWYDKQNLKKYRDEKRKRSNPLCWIIIHPWYLRIFTNDLKIKLKKIVQTKSTIYYFRGRYTDNRKWCE